MPLPPVYPVLCTYVCIIYTSRVPVSFAKYIFTIFVSAGTNCNLSGSLPRLLPQYTYLLYVMGDGDREAGELHRVTEHRICIIALHSKYDLVLTSTHLARERNVSPPCCSPHVPSQDISTLQLHERYKLSDMQKLSSCNFRTYLKYTCRWTTPTPRRMTIYHSFTYDHPHFHR